MKPQSLKELAERFESVSEKYSSDDDVVALQGALADIIAKIKRGYTEITASRLPGEYIFQEKGLDKYPDLEAAYSNLKLALLVDAGKFKAAQQWAKWRREGKSPEEEV